MRLQVSRGLAMETPMNNTHKHLNLAAAVLTVTLLILQNAEAALELLSKVVNYAAHIRKLQRLIPQKGQADLRSKRLQFGPWQEAAA